MTIEAKVRLSPALQWAIGVAIAVVKEHRKMSEGTARKAARHMTELTGKHHVARMRFAQDQVWWYVVEDKPVNDNSPSNKQRGGTI